MFLNDRETATDFLYYEAIAKTVVNLIRKTPDAPITIGVHGDWGAGKSSVLKMLEGAFASDKRVLCLWFNGWTFEGFEDAKTVVIETIVDELRRARPNSRKFADAAKKVLKRVDWLKLARKAGGFARGLPPIDCDDGTLVADRLLVTTRGLEQRHRFLLPLDSPAVRSLRRNPLLLRLFAIASGIPANGSGSGLKR